MQQLNIKTFGTFAISCRNITVSETDNRTRKIWRLIKYLAANRNRPVPQHELAELLGCSDNSDSYASLKTMLHRARNTLEKLDPECRNLILLKNGSYYWNTEIEQSFDEDVFKSLFETAIITNVKVNNLEVSIKTLDLYRGYYLDKSFDDIPTIAEKIQRYHKMALKLYDYICERLCEAGDYAMVRSLSLDASNIDPYHESVHYYLIKSCIELSLHDEALTYYKRVNDLYLGKFRISPSDRIRTLYRYIVKESNFTEKNIKRVGEDLLLPRSPNAPLYCEYDSFRLACSVIVNTVPNLCKRVGALALFTVEFTSDEHPSPAQMRTVMKNLQSILNANLDSSDFFTRYSISQYLASVNIKNPSKCERITKDVTDAFNASIGDYPLRLIISLQIPEQ